MERRRKFGTPRRRVALLLAAAAAVTGMALPAGAQAQGQGKKVLIYTGTTGFRHTDGINGGRPTIQSRLEGLGYTVALEDCSSRATLEINLRPTHCNHPNQNPRVFTAANLAQYDAIVFLNSSWSWGGGGDAATGPLLEGTQKDALVGYLQNGGGIAAIHNMTDAAAGGSAWDWWDGSPNSVMGTTMPGHAATNANGNAATVQVADKNHLSTKDLPDTWTIADEHYNYLRNVRGGHHVLATFDERTYTPGVNGVGQDHPITWCKLYNGANVNDGTSTPKAYTDGRTWNTGMGHFGVRYTENGGNNNMVNMMVGGIRWVAGEGKKTDCSGTVWSSFKRTVLVADANQPIGIDASKDGKVYWSEAGLAGTAADNYESQGAIMMHDQNGAPGNKTTVAVIPTRADHGNSEDGVLGFTLQHGFDLADPNKRNVFAYVSPRPGPGDNWPTGTTNPPAQVLGYNQVMRWTLTADGKSVVPGSERVILRVPKMKIGGTTSTANPPVPGQGAPSGFPGGPTDSGPGHVGGAGLDFDSAGNLYLGVGDDVSPNASGHSGYAPLDYRAQERWDARKTSANSADLRGKVLRIRPSTDVIAPGTTPGSGNTYSIPAGNLFPEGLAKTRPEIYAMGFRQPFTLHTDPKNPGIVGVGEFGHDASADNAGRGSAGIVEWNLVNKPGNHGWPFCMGDNSAANSMVRWNYQPPAATTGLKYDCSLDSIPSDIRYAPAGQTAVQPTYDGLDMIAKPEPATIWKKYANTGNAGVQNALDFGNLTTGGMSPMAGPIYRYDASKVGSGAFPAYYDGSWFINNRGSNDGFWKEVKMRQDNNQMLRVHDWLPYNHAGSATTQQNSLAIGTQFGDDGALYMGRYPVGCCRNNTNASSRVQIVKVSFEVYEESTAPTTSVALDPATPGAGRTYAGPVTVNFTAQDTAGAGQIVSGIDYVEQRVTLNGAAGDWQRTTNVGTANPYRTSAPLSEHGNYVVEYRAVDRGGNVAETKSVAFTIFSPSSVNSDVKATVPSTLALSLTPVNFGAFVPGVANQYTGTGTATVTSTWPSASLTVRDATGNNTGRLLNGTNVLASTLQAVNSTGGNSNISANAVTLKTWAAPVSSENSTVTFRQSIGATEALAMGGYSKSLTFTLTTTTP